MENVLRAQRALAEVAEKSLENVRKRIKEEYVLENYLNVRLRMDVLSFVLDSYLLSDAIISVERLKSIVELEEKEIN